MEERESKLGRSEERKIGEGVKGREEECRGEE